MKYSKIYQHTDSKFYVLINAKKFMPHAASDTREEATEKAAVESALWNIEQAKKALAKTGNLLKTGTSGDNENYYCLANKVAVLKSFVEEAQTCHDDFDSCDPCTWG